MSTPGPQLAIVDYGMGNLRSVEKAFERVGARPLLTGDRARIEAADGVVLPGVGAFPRAMARIADAGLDRSVAACVEAGVPLLGICLGMQLLFEGSEELGGAEGLGLLEGSVTRLEAPGLKVPHMGWEPVSWRSRERLNASVAEATPFYFVHSFAARPAQEQDVLGVAAFGADEYCCAIARPPIWGLQFHPEKSSSAGLELLAGFASICAEGAPVAA